MLTDWTFDPLQLAPVVLAALAYGMRARTLRRRGTPMARWRVALFTTGIALLLLSLASPVASLGERELFSLHMLQHVVIGDLAPLCLLGGLSGPMLRPLLALRPVERLRVLANPAVICVIPGTGKPEHMRDNVQAGLGLYPDAAMVKRMVADVGV